MRDKRAQFFLLAAVACLALVPLAHDDYKRVTFGVAVVYAGLAVASYLDHRGRH